MFAFAFVANLRDGDSCSTRVCAMLDAWPYAAAESRETRSARNASAGILKWTVLRRDRTVCPIWDEASRRLFVGDVRLYNRDELFASLGLSVDEASDAEMAWLAYRRWGPDALNHLVGDFCFVVWDDGNRSLFAARDHLGVRPLYYRLERDRILIASDVGQILPVATQPLKIDALTIAATFVGPTRSHRRTYFEGVTRLPGGHCMTLDRTGIHERRYWAPELGDGRRLTYGEHCERIRHTFTNAVRARLESEKPIVAHSSGGFDSSAILMVANQIYEQEPSRTSLIMASAMAPGMPCDDSAYMDAVARSVRFKVIRWNVLETNARGLHDQFLACPGIRKGTGGGEERDLILAGELGARVLISGVLGDTVMHASGVMRDMVRGGDWAEVLQFTVGNNRSPAPIRLIIKGLLGYLSPEHALRILRSLTGRSSRRPPRWMAPRLRKIFPLPPTDLAVLLSSSHLTTDLWAQINSPSSGRVIDSMVAYGIRAGLETRLPFADHRLIERILEVPWRDRLPQGDARRLGRDALGAVLPAEFERRRDQGSWMPVFVQQAGKVRRDIRALLSDSAWASAPYVSQSTVKKLYDRTEDPAYADPQDVTILTGLGVLEAWLRLVRQSLDCDI